MDRTRLRAALPAMWRLGRRGALVLAAVWCVVLGVGMTAVIVDRGSLGQTATPILLAVIAMLVLPGLTAIALRFDARERRKQRISAPALSPISRNAAGRTIPGPPSRRSARRDTPEHRTRTTQPGAHGQRVA